jgi:hypothetical protein
MLYMLWFMVHLRRSNKETTYIMRPISLRWKGPTYLLRRSADLATSGLLKITDYGFGARMLCYTSWLHLLARKKEREDTLSPFASLRVHQSTRQSITIKLALK